MAENVVLFLSERLHDMLREEANYLIEVPRQVMLLQQELQLMKRFLKDADSRQEGDDVVREFVAQIRDSAYEAEDVIDTFCLKVEPRGKGLIENIRRICPHFSLFLTCGTRVNLVKDVGSKIEDIKAHISQLTQRLDTYGIKRSQVGEVSSSAESGLKTLRRTYSRQEDQGNVVGLADDADRLSSQLVRQGSSRFVSICGMGGLGKTTLAKKVYHHDQVRGHFRYFVWVYVSQKCQAREIWEEILFKVNEEKKRENEEKDKEIEEKKRENEEKEKESKEKKKEKKEKKDHEISTELYDLLLKERCLVVLDDIWNANTWTALSSGFPAHNVQAETKMLLTSRNKDVAYRADPKGFLYEPTCLSEGAAWELFQKVVFEHAGNATFSP